MLSTVKNSVINGCELELITLDKTWMLKGGRDMHDTLSLTGLKLWCLEGKNR